MKAAPLLYPQPSEKQFTLTEQTAGSVSQTTGNIKRGDTCLKSRAKRFVCSFWSMIFDEEAVAYVQGQTGNVMGPETAEVCFKLFPYFITLV